MSQTLTEEDWADAAALVAEEKAQAWRDGDLLYKIVDDATQLALYQAIKASAARGAEYCTEGARKLGKSWLHGVIALETALRNPGKQINWVTATKTACRAILLPILEEISRDAPPDCKGRYSQLDSQWVLPNRAFIRLVGAETRQDCENSRGPSSVLQILDEAGFIALLEYLVDSILSPQMRRVGRKANSFTGMTLMVSTTPYAPSHYFCQRADMASLRGNYKKLTIYDSGWETKEEIEAYIAAEAVKKGLTVEAFKKTSTFRREYLSERVIDEENVVFPEFHVEREHIVKAWPRPLGFERYVHKRTSIDLGMSDKTGLLFGYVDFTEQKAILEGERLLDKPNTETIAKVVRETESELWANAEGGRTSRVVDDPHGRVVLDLWELQKLRTDKAIKHDRDASIGMVRTMIQQHRLIIDPSLIQLQKQLLEATKDGTKRDFARNADGHYDLCAALMYFVRGLDFTTNPYPAGFDALTGGLMPATHPLVARREAMLQGVPQRGLAAQILGQNRWVAGQLRRRR